MKSLENFTNVAKKRKKSVHFGAFVTFGRNLSLFALKTVYFSTKVSLKTNLFLVELSLLFLASKSFEK